MKRKIDVDELKSGDYFRYRGRRYLCVVNVRKDGEPIAAITAKDLDGGADYAILLLCRGFLVYLIDRTDEVSIRRHSNLPRELTPAVERRLNLILEKERGRGSTR